MRQVRSIMVRAVLSLGVLALLVGGCGDGGATSGADVPVAPDEGVDIAGGEVSQPEVESPDAGCTKDADCTGKTETLGACEVASCTSGSCVNAPAADGAACDDANACTSGDACKAGACAGTAKTCDDKSPCTADGCDVKSGECTFDAKKNDGEACSDGDACTDEDLCKDGKCLSFSEKDCDDKKACTVDSCDGTTGECKHAKTPSCEEGSSPCLATNTTGSNDPATTTCVCTIDPYCCETAWDGYCVDEAKNQCGYNCDCASKSKEELACLTDSDCTWCKEGGGEFGTDLCTDTWTCKNGTCVGGGAVICDTSGDTGCAITACQPFSGLCEKEGQDNLCDDGDPCTGDYCGVGTGECIFSPKFECGQNHPCEAKLTPTSNDAAINECVCAIDSYCCSYEWSPSCVETAKASCGLVCDCKEAPPTCIDDGDCGWCDDGNACTGVWSCQDGTCAMSDPVECDPSDDTGCIKNLCNASNGLCEIVAEDGNCNDQEVCTKDACDKETGECTNEPLEGCGLNHPCLAVTTPGSKDAEMTACVCQNYPYCCAQAWDGYCVYLAETFCNLECDCKSATEEALACTEDADCTWCDDGDLCNGAWTCQDGLCAEAPPVECDTSGDEGCMHTLCNPKSAECEYVPVVTDCVSDGDGCTQELCLEDGSCTSEPIETCGMNHPCVESATPTSNKPEVTSCVCAQSPYCCEVAWDYYCVYLAEQSCGVQCGDCSLMPDDQKACEADEDCEYCNTSPICQGLYSCIESVCTADGSALECDTSEDQPCVSKNVCVESVGDCVVQTPDEYCDDGDWCTVDTCEGEDQCVYTPEPFCF